jgi:hypothetical protein
MNRFFRNLISAPRAKKTTGVFQNLLNGSRLIIISLLCCSIIGCWKKEATDATAEKARQDSLIAVIRSAQERSAQGASRIINPSTSVQPNKFSAFSETAIKSAQKKPGVALVNPAAKNSGANGNSDTAGTLESAIEIGRAHV